MVILILIGLGLTLGSFVNAFVWRHYHLALLAEEKESLSSSKKSRKKDLEEIASRRKALSISTGRSMCPHCHHPLAVKDLIPVLSYVMLRGKCRYCGQRIDDTPLAELLTPLLLVISYLFWPVPVQGSAWVLFGIWLVFVVGFVVLIVYDLRWFLLPHNIVLPLIGLAAVYVLLDALVFGDAPGVITAASLGALTIGGLFYALYKLSKEKWIGGGDITLGILLGLLVGGPAQAFLLIFIASLLGTFVAIPLLATRKASRSTHLPFGPFLIIAGIIVMLFGQQIIDWYSNFIVSQAGF